MTDANSSTPLSLLCFACSPYMANAFADRMRRQGVDVTAKAILDSEEGDAEVIRSISSKNWNCWMIGHGLMHNRTQSQRISDIVKRTNPDIPILDYQSQSDVENAILRQFGIRLPLATI